MLSKGGFITVSSVLELSAANFAGICAGDILLQMDDLRIDCLGDARYADIAKRFFYFTSFFFCCTRIFAVCLYVLLFVRPWQRESARTRDENESACVPVHIMYPCVPMRACA